jgi:hypothetical protein
MNKDQKNLEMLYEANILQKAGQALGFGKKPIPTNTPQQPQRDPIRQWLASLPDVNLYSDLESNGYVDSYQLQGLGQILQYSNGKWIGNDNNEIPNNLEAIKSYVNAKLVSKPKPESKPNRNPLTPNDEKALMGISQMRKGSPWE